MTTATTITNQLTFADTLAAFLRVLDGKNRSQATLSAYRTDLEQFVAWLHTNTLAAHAPRAVVRADIEEFLAHLAHQGMSGLSRARKLAALREYFRHLVESGAVEKSPTTGIETPKKERKVRAWLLRDEYARMLSLAGANARDYCILQLFLQTGIRVSELCKLHISDVDLSARRLTVREGKGKADREIDLERKGVQALKQWLSVRLASAHEFLFVNRYGEPLGERGVKKLVTKYRVAAGITKKAGCHALRHTFGTIKAEQGVSPFQLKEWMGHANLNTTQAYVHMSRKNAQKVMEGTSL